MKKRILYWVLMVVLALLLAGPQAIAAEKGEADTPPAAEKEAVSEEAAAGEEAAGKAEEQKKETHEKCKEAKEKAEE